MMQLAQMCFLATVVILFRVQKSQHFNYDYLNDTTHIEGILPKGPYLPCVNMAGRALLAGYPRHDVRFTCIYQFSKSDHNQLNTTGNTYVIASEPSFIS